MQGSTDRRISPNFKKRKTRTHGRSNRSKFLKEKARTHWQPIWSEFLKGDEGIYGPPNQSEFQKGDTTCIIQVPMDDLFWRSFGCKYIIYSALSKEVKVQGCAKVQKRASLEPKKTVTRLKVDGPRSRKSGIITVNRLVKNGPKV